MNAGPNVSRGLVHIIAITLVLCYVAFEAWGKFSVARGREMQARRLLDARTELLNGAPEAIELARESNRSSNEAAIRSPQELMLRLSEIVDRDTQVNSLSPGQPSCLLGTEYEVVEATLTTQPNRLASILEAMQRQSVFITSLRIRPATGDKIRAEVAMGVADQGHVDGHR